MERPALCIRPLKPAFLLPISLLNDQFSERGSHVRFKPDWKSVQRFGAELSGQSSRRSRLISAARHGPAGRKSVRRRAGLRDAAKLGARRELVVHLRLVHHHQSVGASLQPAFHRSSIRQSVRRAAGLRHHSAGAREAAPPRAITITATAAAARAAAKIPSANNFSNSARHLQSGNLSSAQQAYATLQQDFQSFSSGDSTTTSASSAISAVA